MLAEACRYGRRDMVDWLLNNGAKVTSQFMEWAMSNVSLVHGI